MLRTRNSINRLTARCSRWAEQSRWPQTTYAFIPCPHHEQNAKTTSFDMVKRLATLAEARRAKPAHFGVAVQHKPFSTLPAANFSAAQANPSLGNPTSIAAPGYPSALAATKKSDTSAFYQPVRQKPRSMRVVCDSEVGSPASELSPYHQVSVPMPTLEQVDLAVRTIRKEQRKTRFLTNTVYVFGVCIVIGMCARESDNATWLLAARFSTWYLSPEIARTLYAQQNRRLYTVNILAVMLRLGHWDRLPSDTRIDDPFLKMTVAGLPLPNPIGLAAGYDAAGESPESFLKMGFGFVEIGTVTPFADGTEEAQQGVVYVSDEKSLLRSRDSLSSGVQVVAKHLARFSKARWQHDLSRLGVLGVNIGTNNDTRYDGVVARHVAPYADYVVLNLASGKRRWFEENNLRALIKNVKNALDVVVEDMEVQKKKTLARLREERVLELPPNDEDFLFTFPNLTGRRCALFIKFETDLTEKELETVTAVAVEMGLDGLVVSGHTSQEAAKADARCPTVNTSGVISGKAVKATTQAYVYKAYQLTKGKIPIIASGGIFLGQDALEMVEAGAHAVQVYSALMYEGPGIARHIKSQLSTLMYSKGYHALQDAVGASHKRAKKTSLHVNKRNKRLTARLQ